MAGSESSHEGEGGTEEKVEEGEEEVLGKVTNVVKAVMELSNRVSLSPPDEYLELVKVGHVTCQLVIIPLSRVLAWR